MNLGIYAKDWDGDSGHRTKMIAIGVYDTLDEAINEAFTARAKYEAQENEK